MYNGWPNIYFKIVTLTYVKILIDIYTYLHSSSLDLILKYKLESIILYINIYIKNFFHLYTSIPREINRTGKFR